jgi:hypothetical protein
VLDGGDAGLNAFVRARATRQQRARGSWP